MSENPSVRVDDVRGPGIYPATGRKAQLSYGPQRHLHIRRSEAARPNGRALKPLRS